jgi:hypothetical protein
MVGGHFTVVLEQEYVALFGVVWEDQLCRGQPVYFIVIVPADASNDAEIMDDLAKSEEEVGHAVAVLSVGGWQRDGATAQRSSINTTETPCEGIIMQQRLIDQRSCFLPHATGAGGSEGR